MQTVLFMGSRRAQHIQLFARTVHVFHSRKCKPICISNHTANDRRSQVRVKRSIERMCLGKVGVHVCKRVAVAASDERLSYDDVKIVSLAPVITITCA